MLSKWILYEKLRQIKEEITNKAYEPIDKAQNVESRDGTSINGEYEEPYLTVYVVSSIFRITLTCT